MKLISQNTELDINPDTTVDFNGSSPLFNPLSGDNTMPFELPGTQKNLSYFGNPHLPTSGGDVRREFPVQLWLGSFLWREGTLRIRNTRKTRQGVTIFVNCQFTPGNIPQKTWFKNLNELDLGSERIPTVQKLSTFYYTLSWASFNLLQTIVYFSADYYVSMEIYADNTLIARSNYTGYVRVGFNPTDADLKRRLSTSQGEIDVLQGSVTINEEKISVKLDNQATNVVVKFASLIAGDSLEGNANGRYPKAMQKMSYTTIADTYYTPKIDNEIYCLPQIKNFKFYSDLNKQFFGIINEVIDGKIALNSDAYMSSRTIIPQIKLKWLFKKLSEILGYSFNGSFITHPEILKLILFNLYSTDKQSPDTSVNFNVHNEVITYANHLPPIKLGDFFQALVDEFCLGIEFNPLTKAIDMYFFDDVINQPEFLDLSGRLSYAHESEVIDLKPIQYKFVTDSGDETVTDTEAIFLPNPSKETVEASTETYENKEFKFPSLVVKTVNNVRQIPQIAQAGVSPLFNQSKNKSPLRLLFWENKKADNKTNDVSLTLNGANNLLDKFHKQKINFLKNEKPYKYTTLLTLQELVSFKFKRKIFADGVWYIAGDFRVKFKPYHTKFEVEIYLHRWYNG